MMPDFTAKIPEIRLRLGLRSRHGEHTALPRLPTGFVGKAVAVAYFRGMGTHDSFLGVTRKIFMLALLVTRGPRVADLA